MIWGGGCLLCLLEKSTLAALQRLDVREARLETEKSDMTIILVQAKDNEILS